MPGFLENVGKAAMRGAARAAARAELAAQRVQLQGDLERREREVVEAYARLGRLVHARISAGEETPAGADPLLAAIREAEAAAAAVRKELARCGGEPPR